METCPEILRLASAMPRQVVAGNAKLCSSVLPKLTDVLYREVGFAHRQKPVIEELLLAPIP